MEGRQGLKNFKWIDVEKRLPGRTSSYLVFVQIVTLDGLSFGACRTANYDAINNVWYVHRFLNSELIGPVEYWAELPDDPMEEE